MERETFTQRIKGGIYKMDKFIGIVADLFGCDREELSLDTAYGEYERWDSMMMLRLIMEIEEEYAVSIPIEDAGKIKTLADMYRYVEKG